MHKEIYQTIKLGGTAEIKLFRPIRNEIAFCFLEFKKTYVEKWTKCPIN